MGVWRKRNITTQGTRFRSLWLKLASVSVLAVMLPILSLGCWFYASWETNQISNFKEQGKNRLRSIALTIQQNLHMVDNDVLLLKQSAELIQFKRMSRPGEHVALLQSVSTRLTELRVKYAYLHSVYFYDDRSQTFITNVSGAYDADEFYDTNWLNQMMPTSNVQRLPLRTNVDSGILKDEKRLRALMFEPEQVLTIAGIGSNGIRAALNINALAFYHYLDGIYTFAPDEFIVVDRQGRIVLGADAPHFGNTYDGIGDISLTDMPDLEEGFHHIDGQYIFLHPMQRDELMCILSFPDTTLDVSNKLFRNYVVLICGLLLVAVLVISLLVTRKIYSPVSDLLLSIRSLPSPEGGLDEAQIRDEISYIKRLFTDLSGNREAMNTTLEDYRRALRVHEYRNHLNGLTPYDRMADLWPDRSLFEGHPGRICLFRIPKSTQDKVMAATRVQVGALINAYIEKNAHGLFFDLDGEIFLAHVSAERTTDMDAVLHMTRRLLSEMLGTHVWSGESDLILAPDQLGPAYQQAHAACRHATFFSLSENIVNGVSLNGCSSCDFSTVINHETLIIRSILFLDSTQARNALRALHTQLEAARDVEFAKGVSLRLLTTLENEFSLNATFNVNVLEIIHDLDNLEEIIAQIRDLVLETITHMEKNREVQQDHVMRAKEYLEAHYTDCSLSVCHIAEDLGISYPYLSKIFKETTGMGLLDFLNNIRIEKGKEVLRQRNDNLGIISEMVGYSNAQSFQRFFKKIVGMTPGEYRNRALTSPPATGPGTSISSAGLP